MDEILASIRRIISEDEAAAGGAHQGPGESRHHEREGEILVLTDPIPPDAPSPHDTSHHAAHHPHADHHSPHPNGAPPAPPPSPPSAPASGASQSAPGRQGRSHHRRDDGLVDRGAAAEVSEAFEELHRVVDSAAPRPTPAASSSGPTLEDIARDLLRPMIAAWLDEHLPHIVRSRVDEEIERITRTRVR